MAVALAWALAWASRRPGPWRWVTAASVATALALPGPVAGMAWCSRTDGFPTVYDSPAMVVLADVLRTFPYALLVLWPAVRDDPARVPRCGGGRRPRALGPGLAGRDSR